MTIASRLHAQPDVETVKNEKTGQYCQTTGCTCKAVAGGYCLFHFRIPPSLSGYATDIIRHQLVHFHDCDMPYSLAAGENRSMAMSNVFDDEYDFYGHKHHPRLMAKRVYKYLHQRGLIPQEVIAAIRTEQDFFDALLMRNGKRIRLEEGGFFCTDWLSQLFETTLVTEVQDTAEARDAKKTDSESTWEPLAA